MPCSGSGQVPKHDPHKMWVCPVCNETLVKSMATDDLLRVQGAQTLVAIHGVTLSDSEWIAETEYVMPMTDEEIESYQEPIGVCQYRVCYCYTVDEGLGLACHD